MKTEKIMAVGLELKSGQWKLFENGTLQFIGEGCLFGGIYRSYKNQIRRIEIYGCQEITAFQFSELPFWEEVYLDQSVKTVGIEAFFDCPKLHMVSMGEDVAVKTDAFAMTPYAGDLPLCSEDPLEVRPRVRAFWEEMERCLATLQKPYESEES